MYLQRLLQINMATLAALGTLLVGMGQRSATLPLLMSIAAITSVWLTDITGWFRLNRKVANVAALVALVLTARELLQFNSVTQVLGLARLLIYVQIILLFQEKDLRTYRHLIIMSLLQVVVAAIFLQGVWFGGLLIVYMLVGLSALALLCLHREHERMRPDAEPVSVPFTGSASRRAAGEVGRELFGRLAMIGLATLGLTLLLFLTVPRFGRTAWRGPTVVTKHVVGFSDTMTLGELGEIIENPEEVMRIWLTDATTSQPYAVRGELYLRGAVLTHYQRGTWQRQKAKGTEAPIAAADVTVLQRIDIEPLDRNELFCLWPPILTEANNGLQFEGDRLVRSPSRRTQRFTLGTTALADGIQTPLVPYRGTKDGVESLLQTPELPQLAAQAERWAADSGLADDDRMALARHLTRRFLNARQFEYSLQGQPRDESIDPIEDFITNNPRGHCEYFATALSLMLRSRGIPSRVVIGYKCDELNQFDRFYQVRQWHAHSWVEAYLEPSHLPESLHQGEDARRWHGGAWLRLEPTPGASADNGDESSSRELSLLDRFERSFERLQTLWGNYVMEMDRDLQRKAIYQPIVRAVQAAIENLSDPQWWRNLAQRVVRAVDPTGWAAGHWVLGVVILLVGLPAAVFGVRRVRRTTRRLWSRLAGRAVSRAGVDLPEIEFYRRLEMLLARHGLRRTVGQTQREFAREAGLRLAEITGHAQLTPLPAQVVEAYYGVRFGRLPLDNDRAETVEQALRQLAACQASSPV
ncbi:MAG: transglutaminaseTgpA domain-containing protein [Thermoguttaceae bacterium]